MKPATLNIGDWVFDKEGKLRRINSDSMPDLPYEDIERVATAKENPNFEFTLSHGVEDGWVNLTKENFFNHLMVKCPLSVQCFCNWVDEYKRQVKWAKLFREEIKFHDIPWEMQFGILMDFFSFTTGSCGYQLNGDWQEVDELVEFIINDFIYLEVGIRNGDYEIYEQPSE